MKCPYCGAETEHGYIEGGSTELNWKPNKTGPFKSGNAELNPGAVLLSPFSAAAFFSKNRVEAQLCRKCRKIVIDCPREREE